jgi:hypothetical protein
VKNKQKEKFENNRLINIICIDGARKIEMHKDRQSIGVILTLITIVLWWTETSDGKIGEYNAYATVALKCGHV